MMSVYYLGLRYQISTVRGYRGREIHSMHKQLHLKLKELELTYTLKNYAQTCSEHTKILNHIIKKNILALLSPYRDKKYERKKHSLQALLMFKDCERNIFLFY